MVAIKTNFTTWLHPDFASTRSIIMHERPSAPTRAKAVAIARKSDDRLQQRRFILTLTATGLALVIMMSLAPLVLR
jgi:accessory gene regulator protein AgrB